MKFVCMPWDDNTTIIHQDNGQDTLYKRWNLVKAKLSNHIPDVDNLVDIIRCYNVYYTEDGTLTTPAWSFRALRQYVDSMETSQSTEFFQKGGILQSIQSLALKMSETCQQIRWLSSDVEDGVSLHQMQLACILANAFFCTFPRRGKNQPSINFNGLFEGGHRNGRNPRHVEKLKCLVHYFSRIHNRQPNGFVSFHRLVTAPDKYPRWDRTNVKLCDLEVVSDGRIEDQSGYLQMDFANRVIGGGVLGWGCVQEEIRFIICPELIAARLFCEPMCDNEAILVIGAERFCNYGGYSDSFYFDGDYQDSTPFDDSQRKMTQILAVDATKFGKPQDQYFEGRILRELKKIYTGLVPLQGEAPIPLATGNWGCGVYRGDPHLKSLLQIMAASQTGRKVKYITFGDKNLEEELTRMYSKLKELDLTVGQLYKLLRRYHSDRRKHETLFQYLSHAAVELVRTYNHYKARDVSNVQSFYNELPSNSNAVPSDSQNSGDPFQWPNNVAESSGTSGEKGPRKLSGKSESIHIPKSQPSSEDSDDFIPCTPENEIGDRSKLFEILERESRKWPKVPRTTHREPIPITAKSIFEAISDYEAMVKKQSGDEKRQGDEEMDVETGKAALDVAEKSNREDQLIFESEKNNCSEQGSEKKSQAIKEPHSTSKRRLTQTTLEFFIKK